MVPPYGEGTSRKWNPRQFALQIRGVAFTVSGVVEESVDVVEDIFSGDGVV